MACCPNCGSAEAVGTQAAALCPDCAQVTLLGVSMPLTAVVAAVLAVACLAVAGMIFRRLRQRRTHPAVAALAA